MRIKKILLLTLLFTFYLSACGKQNRNTSTDPAGVDSAVEQNTTDSLQEDSPADNPRQSNLIGDTDLENLQNSENNGEDTTVSKSLHVSGTYLADENDNPVQLYGMSTHGLSWFPQYVTYDTFQTLRDDWGTNCVRLAMYSGEYNGYCTGGDKEELKNLIKSGVEYATDLDMYVIIDWHVLGDQDPNVYIEEAKTFFREMSSAYADYDNVLYEICNEPNGYTTWEHVTAYANTIIPIIRENDSDAVIIVGTPTWSQDIDKAADAPLEYDNILYALHFYANTHKDDLRSRLETCINNGLPVFVSEFGTCDASGNGGNNFDETTKWLELLDKNHLSYCCWNLANKAESSSAIKSDIDKVSGWTADELSESGQFMREWFRKKAGLSP